MKFLCMDSKIPRCESCKDFLPEFEVNGRLLCKECSKGLKNKIRIAYCGLQKPEKACLKTKRCLQIC